MNSHSNPLMASTLNDFARMFPASQYNVPCRAKFGTKGDSCEAHRVDPALLAEPDPYEPDDDEGNDLGDGSEDGFDCEQTTPCLPNSGYPLTHEEAQAMAEEATRNFPRTETGD